MFVLFIVKCNDRIIILLEAYAWMTPKFKMTNRKRIDRYTVVRPIGGASAKGARNIGPDFAPLMVLVGIAGVLGSQTYQCRSRTRTVSIPE